MTTPDSGPALGRPAPDIDLRGFPRAPLAAGTLLYRCHSVRQRHWWFASRGPGAGGRFDLPAPRGTHYVASDVETAVRERLREQGRQSGDVPGDIAETFQVTVTRAARSWSCAHVGVKRAARFGVTRELTTLPKDYHETTQAWAEAFAAAGFDGLRYGARFTPGRANAWALFGQGGDAERPEPEIVAVIAGPDACRQAGLSVAGAPVLGHLNIIP